MARILSLAGPIPQRQFSHGYSLWQPAPPPLSSNQQGSPHRRCRLLFIIFIVLLLAWIFSWAVFHVAGGLLHILLIVAVISLILHFVRGRPTTV